MTGPLLDRFHGLCLPPQQEFLDLARRVFGSHAITTARGALK